MNDFKLEHTEPDQTYSVNDPENIPEEQEIEYEYFKVEVEKTCVADVYIKIPVNDKFKSMKRFEQKCIIDRAIDETLDEYDWEFESSYLLNRIDTVFEKEAQCWSYYEVD